ncbi:MAG TPA: glycosyltransferase family 1 protein [Anaeromyxobacter sp.]|nr:glycosyltransferase family 1 protein [Anaeromyxobacter sp.]
MRVAMSLLAFRPGRIGGAETYLRALLAHLPREIAPGDRLAVVMDRDVAAGLETPGFERVVVPKGARRVVAERVLEAFTPWRARDLERLFASLGADVLFFPQQSLYPRRAAGPAVITAVDVQHLAFPEYFGAFDRHYRARVYPPSMEAARAVVAISEFTRTELIERCGVAPGKVVAIPLGTTPLDVRGVVPYPGLATPYLYYPAASHPHKNHETLLRSYAALRRAGRIPHRLVLSGAPTSRWPALARLAEALGIAADVRHLGFLSYADVHRVYAGADAVVFPSRYEGFGLPVVEAVAHGKRAVVSDLPVFRELGVPDAWRIDFADPEQLAAALARPGPTVLARPPPTWTECARRTLATLRSVAERGSLDAAGEPFSPPASGRAPTS